MNLYKCRIHLFLKEIRIIMYSERPTFPLISPEKTLLASLWSPSWPTFIPWSIAWLSTFTDICHCSIFPGCYRCDALSSWPDCDLDYTLTFSPPALPLPNLSNDELFLIRRHNTQSSLLRLGRGERINDTRRIFWRKRWGKLGKRWVRTPLEEHKPWEMLGKITLGIQNRSNWSEAEKILRLGCVVAKLRVRNL